MPGPAAPERPLARTRDVVATHLRVGALFEAQYRVNLWLQLLQSVVALGTAIAVIALVFRYTDDLGGWSVDELLVLLGVHVALGGVIRAVIQPNMQQLMTDVREGTLDFVLLKPVDAQLLVSVRRLAFWKLVDVAVGLGVVAVGVTRLGGVGGLGQLAGFVLTLCLGVVIVYAFWMIITVGAFWFVRLDFVVELFDGLYQAGRWPVTLYPGWLRGVFTVVVPLAFAVTVPAEALAGRLDGGMLLVAVAFTAGVVVVTRVVWRRGLRRYDGASA
jgi:ABC-2 type transport system permease protein